MYTVHTFNPACIQHTHSILPVYSTHIQSYMYTVHTFYSTCIQCTHLILHIYSTHIQSYMYTVHTFNPTCIQYTHSILHVYSTHIHAKHTKNGGHCTVSVVLQNFEAQRNRVSWCFEPSQPLGILSGLKMNFNPPHKSFNVNHNISLPAS